MDGSAHDMALISYSVKCDLTSVMNGSKPFLMCVQQLPAESGETEYQEVSPEHIRAFWHDEDGNSAMEDSM